MTRVSNAFLRLGRVAPRSSSDRPWHTGGPGSRELFPGCTVACTFPQGLSLLRSHDRVCAWATLGKARCLGRWWALVGIWIQGSGAIPEEREENGTRVPLEGDGADGASVASVSFFLSFLSRLRAVGHPRFTSSATPWTGPVQPDSELRPRSPGWIRSCAQPVKGLAIARMFA